MAPPLRRRALGSRARRAEPANAARASSDLRARPQDAACDVQRRARAIPPPVRARERRRDRQRARCRRAPAATKFLASSPRPDNYRLDPSFARGDRSSARRRLGPRRAGSGRLGARRVRSISRVTAAPTSEDVEAHARDERSRTPLRRSSSSAYGTRFATSRAAQAAASRRDAGRAEALVAGRSGRPRAPDARAAATEAPAADAPRRAQTPPRQHLSRAGRERGRARARARMARASVTRRGEFEASRRKIFRVAPRSSAGRALQRHANSVRGAATPTWCPRARGARQGPPSREPRAARLPETTGDVPSPERRRGAARPRTCDRRLRTPRERREGVWTPRRTCRRRAVDSRGRVDRGAAR